MHAKELQTVRSVSSIIIRRRQTVSMTIRCGWDVRKTKPLHDSDRRVQCTIRERNTPSENGYRQTFGMETKDAIPWWNVQNQLNKSWLPYRKWYAEISKMIRGKITTPKSQRKFRTAQILGQGRLIVRLDKQGKLISEEGVMKQITEFYTEPYNTELKRYSK